MPLAIGFEAPLFIPSAIDGYMTTRKGIDGNSPWTMSSSFQCLFPILNQFFSELAEKCKDADIYTSYKDFTDTANPHSILIFESFISRPSKKEPKEILCKEEYDDHDADAHLTVKLFENFCATWKHEMLETACPCRTYMNLPKMFADYHKIKICGNPECG